jgi:hypothetical protein
VSFPAGRDMAPSKDHYDNVTCDNGTIQWL